ncbi:MAG: hypothetical protein AAB421_03840 [Patescibacteria group bacterium]
MQTFKSLFGGKRYWWNAPVEWVIDKKTEKLRPPTLAEASQQRHEKRRAELRAQEEKKHKLAREAKLKNAKKRSAVSCGPVSPPPPLPYEHLDPCEPAFMGTHRSVFAHCRDAFEYHSRRDAKCWKRTRRIKWRHLATV